MEEMRRLFTLLEAGDPQVAFLLWTILFAVFLGWGAMSWILAYHWKSYTFDQAKIALARRVYFAGSALLLAAMAFALALYSI